MGPSVDAVLEVRRKPGRIWSHVRRRWLIETPEERVRQEYLPILVNEYGYDLGLIAEEREVTGRGSGHARADFVLWRTREDRQRGRAPLIVVECKSDAVPIRPADYAQADNYARLTNAQLVVTHNSRETKYWRVRHDRMPKALDEVDAIPPASATDDEIAELLERLRVFKGDEFATLLHECHNVIRNREKKDPGAAFDEIAKILFVKVWVEREMQAKRQRQNLFSAAFVDTQLGPDPVNDLFAQTKRFYHADDIFGQGERIDLRPATSRAIVELLERYNLSDTSEDIKGIAFERFLGRTFRAEIGQFFTPRPVVNLMVALVEPEDGDVVCDPASGSGGFLIRVFEIGRDRILKSIDSRYAAYRHEVADMAASEETKARLLRERHDALHAELDLNDPASPLSRLANECIYGTDANDRMARTSKMNMIMHGDGHGGVHHHDGFVDVDGIFQGRFDIVLTNPPFGAHVEPSDVVLETDGDATPEDARRYRARYGAAYEDAMQRTRAARGEPIASLFDLPARRGAKIRTELLFVERCLQLLKPGGRVAIVLPEGLLSTAASERVRDFVESRAFVEAIVSLPDGTFTSTGADVKASVLFLRKFTNADSVRYEQAALSASDAVSDASTPAASPKRPRTMSREARQQFRKALRESFDYPVFLYDALHVGITPTGGEDYNELYPNIAQPPHITATCSELFAAFRAAPHRFVAEALDQTPPREDELADLLAAPCLPVRWRDLDRWDVKRARAAIYRARHPNYRLLGEYIEDATILVRPWEEPDKKWPVYGVNNRDGVFFSHYQQGAAFKSSYKLIQAGWFFHNPTRSAVGSLGMVPQVPDHAITSPEYQVWRVTGGIVPEYLAAVLATDFFVQLLQLYRTGAVKQRLYVENLKEIPLLVPTEVEQQRLAERYQQARADIEQAQRGLLDVERQLDASLRRGVIG